jgi:stress-induced morphogen
VGAKELVMAKRATIQPEAPRWEDKRTPETREIEEVLRRAGFERADAYRYNSASIRVRVIDPRFEGMSIPDREDMVFPVIDRLKKRTREDILLLLIMAPSELRGRNRHLLVNLEFENPLPSLL